jgi:hypothetical protein
MRGEVIVSGNYNYHITNDKEKIIKICKGKKCFSMKLNQKRAFFVLTKLLERYPNFLNLHEMDDKYNDPNKAYSDLKILEGFEVFIEERKGNKRSIEAKILLDDLWNFFDTRYKDGDTILNPLSKDRNTISKEDQDKIYQKFNGKCNLTGYNLYKEKPRLNLFMKSSLTPSYDHRKPIFQGGPDTTENLQLISELANREKNKICLQCKNIDCDHCALAHPEEFTIIKANGQDIGEIITKIKNAES